jgi:hypothetical protein
MLSNIISLYTQSDWSILQYVSNRYIIGNILVTFCDIYDKCKSVNFIMLNQTQNLISNKFMSIKCDIL